MIADAPPDCRPLSSRLQPVGHNLPRQAVKKCYPLMIEEGSDVVVTQEEQARQLAAEYGQVVGFFKEGLLAAEFQIGQAPALFFGNSPAWFTDDPQVNIWYAFPSGLVLPICEIPWVWKAEVNGHPGTDYLEGTAVEAGVYWFNLPNRIKSLTAVDPASLQGRYVVDATVSLPYRAEAIEADWQDWSEGGADSLNRLSANVLRLVDDHYTHELIEPRPFPAWTRSESGPRHIRWSGVKPGYKVWPMVPTGFTTDFEYA